MFPFVIEMHEKLESTNTVATRRLRQGEDLSFHAILCRQQERGRGTKGRSWVSLDGNIFLSAVIPLVDEPNTEQLSLSAGLAVFRTVKWACSTNRNSNQNLNFFMKWPNDVLINEEKVSGVLIEIVKTFAVVGVGLNIVSAPPLATFLKKYADGVSFWPIVYVLLLELATISTGQNLRTDDM
ncbi:MAG: biotin--[acetyl-CoA-carboxylase] ligase [Holosporales bacterium]|jgi:BirA family biotin operon repressor/biotin-[acetyl-CoA-carboxylase] ligase|nr:biotin--[acetyl-CoA-carboxylase] ligase [Holosporales bacterium]